mmetsp:Transcript_750/g.1164  ORF Transcript_750/g.1164 Transcript_750/m.1164 type:complete len:340 (-) Transcript_750:95-1114(-)
MKVECLVTKKSHSDIVWDVKWSPDGQLLASAGKDKVLRIWRYDTKSNSLSDFQVVTDMHQRSIRSIAFSPDNLMLACASFDGSVSILQRSNKSSLFHLLTKIKGHTSEVKYVAFNNDGTLLATCGRDKTVWVWEYDEDIQEFSTLAVCNGHNQDVKCVQFSPSGSHLVSTSYDNSIITWCSMNMDDYERVNQFRHHDNIVWQVDFEKNGEYMGSVSQDGTLKVYKFILNQGSESKDMFHDDSIPFTYGEVFTSQKDSPSLPIYSLSFSPSKELLIATGGATSNLDIYYSKTNAKSLTKELSFANAHDGDINRVAFHPSDACVLATCSDDETVKLWKLSL